MLLPVLALSMAGCDREIIVNADGKEGCEKATFFFTPEFAGCDEASTKSLAVQPDVKNIFFAVFDAAGFKLSEYAEAVPNTLADKNGKLFLYSVELTVTDQPRVVHIIANAPEKIKFGSETEVIGTLVTQYNAAETGDFDRKDAYWQRVYLENGVCAAPKAELKTTNPTAYNAQLATYQGIINALDSVKLIRNFAQLTVTEKAANFEMTGFWITNYPEKGSVAPYNRTTGQFQNDYAEYDDISELMAADKGNYKGYSPVSTNLVSISGKSSTELSALKIDAAEQFHTFCYEREVPKKDPLYIIVAGKFNGDGSETYYKIDLRDNNGEYFPILRNFNYRISINNVYRAGASSVQGALASAPSGNIDSSIDMQGLDNISDGVAQIYVGETDVVLVGDGNVQLRYKFIPDVTNPASANNTTAPASGSDHTPYVTFTTSYGSTGAVFDQTDANAVKGVVASVDEADGYRVVTLTSVTPTDVVKNQEITITGHYWADNKWQTISRTVSYHLRKKLDMTVSCNPGKVPRGTGQEFDLIIGLEAGLPSSIFSLDMDIEARNLSITTNNDPLPLSSGLSYINDKPNLPSFYFTKTITWTDYQEAEVVNGYKYFTCHFKTNKGLADGDVIYVNNKYFTQNSASYTTYTAKNFTNLSFGSANIKTGEPVTFSYTLNDGIPTDSKVLVGLIGFEEAPTDATAGYTRKLRYVGTKTDTYNGTTATYELYEMTVSGSTSSSVDCSISLVPFRTGTGYIKLWADEYLPNEKSAHVTTGNKFWITEFKIDPVSPSNWTSTAEGEPFVGQTFKTTLKAQLINNSGSSVNNAKVNGQNASASITDNVLTIEYVTSYNISEFKEWTVTADLTIDGSNCPLSEVMELVVWTPLTITKGNAEVGSISNLSEGCYIAISRNNDSSKLLYASPDNNVSPYDYRDQVRMNNISGNTLAPEYIWQVKNLVTTDTRTCKLLSYSCNKYISNDTNTGHQYLDRSGTYHTSITLTDNLNDAATLILAHGSRPDQGDDSQYHWTFQLQNQGQYFNSAYNEDLILDWYSSSHKFKMFVCTISNPSRPTR